MTDIPIPPVSQKTIPVGPNPFGNSGVKWLMDAFRAVLEDSGAADIVGGSEVLDQGFRQLKAGVLPLAAELVAIDGLGLTLADAVYDAQSWPRVAEVHGYMTNLLTMNIPAELLPWAKRLFQMLPPPGVGAIRHGLVATAVQDPNPLGRGIARFFTFEGICLVQRLTLLQEGVHVEALGGRRRDVEILAEAELKILEGVDAYQVELLGLDDPLYLLQGCGLAGLHRHIEVLKAELSDVSAEIHEVLDRRRRLLEVSSRLDPADGAVLLNGTATEFGEEEVPAHHLRRLNPMHLGKLSDAAIWKRKERLPGKIAKLAAGRSPSATPSLADLMLEASQEMN